MLPVSFISGFDRSRWRMRPLREAKVGPGQADIAVRAGIALAQTL
jgi:hypothetical protein